VARHPRGYLGIHHETIGSDILAVLHTLTFPRAVLGVDMVNRLEKIQPDGWYPISWLLELMEIVEQRVGTAGLLKLGRTLFHDSHEDYVVARAHSARDIVYGIDELYHRANRGRDIGGWQVLAFEPGRATLEKTTPHHCVMEEGILGAGLTVVGVLATVAQRECFRKGADACIYVVESAITDARWSGGKS
jgi:hypothetical protein